MTGSIEQEKKRLRATLLEGARGLGERRRELESMIRDHLGQQVDRLGCAVLMGFAPIGSEPDIGPLLDRWRVAGIDILLPKVMDAQGRMEPVRLVGPLEGIRSDALGIPTPEGPPVEPEQLDAVIVPGCGFDARLRRLGRGGGYYDRFLARCGRPTTIGVCFDCQLVERIPEQPHDRRVDLVVTESGVRPAVG